MRILAVTAPKKNNTKKTKKKKSTFFNSDRVIKLNLEVRSLMRVEAMDYLGATDLARISATSPAFYEETERAAKSKVLALLTGGGRGRGRDTYRS